MAGRAGPAASACRPLRGRCRLGATDAAARALRPTALGRRPARGNGVSSASSHPLVLFCACARRQAGTRRATRVQRCPTACSGQFRIGVLGLGMAQLGHSLTPARRRRSHARRPPHARGLPSLPQHAHAPGGHLAAAAALVRRCGRVKAPVTARVLGSQVSPAGVATRARAGHAPIRYEVGEGERVRQCLAAECGRI